MFRKMSVIKKLLVSFAAMGFLFITALLTIMELAVRDTHARTESFLSAAQHAGVFHQAVQNNPSWHSIYLEDGGTIIKKENGRIELHYFKKNVQSQTFVGLNELVAQNPNFFHEHSSVKLMYMCKICPLRGVVEVQLGQDGKMLPSARAHFYD